MSSIRKISFLAIISLFLVLLFLPFTTITAKADYGDLLYIEIDMDASYVYNVEAFEPDDIYYWEDAGHTIAATVDEISDVDVYYYTAADYDANGYAGGTPIATPENVGDYVVAVIYQDAGSPPDYEDTIEVHYYSITPVTLYITAQSATQVYRNVAVTPDYDFAPSNESVLTFEFGENNPTLWKEGLFEDTDLSRSDPTNEDVGEYDIVNTLELAAAYEDTYTVNLTSDTYEFTPKNIR